MRLLSIAIPLALLVGCSTGGTFLMDPASGKIYGPLYFAKGEDIQMSPTVFDTEYAVRGRYRVVQPTPGEIEFHRRLDTTVIRSASFAQTLPQDLPDALESLSIEYAPAGDRYAATHPLKVEVDLTDYVRRNHCSLCGQHFKTNAPPLFVLECKDRSLWDVLNVFARVWEMRIVIQGETITLTQRRDILPQRFSSSTNSPPSPPAP